MKEKIINIRKRQPPNSTTIAIPADVARILQDVDTLKFEFKDGKLIYTPVNVIMEIREV